MTPHPYAGEYRLRLIRPAAALIPLQPPPAIRPPFCPRPGPVWCGASLVVAGAGLGATTALTITAETWSQVTAPGRLATFAGNITGMAGTYLALIMVLLVSRIPFAEHVLGKRRPAALAPADRPLADQPPDRPRERPARACSESLLTIAPPITATAGWFTAGAEGLMTGHVRC